MFAHSRFIIYAGGIARMCRAVEADARAHELCGILVGGGHINVEAIRRAFDRQSAHDIVGLEAIDANDGDAQRLRHLKRMADRIGNIFGHLFALSLVWRVSFVAEGRPRRIHSECHVGRVLAAQNRQKTVDEPKEGRRVHAA